MASIEQLEKSFKTLGDSRHLTIEDYVLAQPRPGETRNEAMHREHPDKPNHPWLIEMNAQFGE